MSHVAQVKTDIKIDDLAILERCCEKIGLILTLNKNTYKWYGTHVGDYPVPAGFQISDLGKCDHCISVKGNSKAYEIGVVERNGELLFLWDFWSGGFGLEKVIGKNAEKLVQAYKQEMIRKQAEQVAIEQAGYLSEYTNEQGEQVFVVETY